MNNIIYQKLAEIDKNSRQNFLKLTKPAFKFKKNQKEIYIKNGIKILAQENLFMLKKLITQESEYKHDKFEQNFQESRKYKNNICHFPCIDFNNSRNSVSPLIQSYDFNVKNYKICNTQGNSPKIKNITKKTNFISLQTKYALNNKELDPHYFKEAIRTNKSNNFNQNKVENNNNNKKFMKSVTEDDDDSSSNNKSDEDDSDNEKKSGSESQSGSNSGSNSGSENEDDKKKGSESGSGSGSGSGGSD